MEDLDFLVKKVKKASYDLQLKNSTERNSMLTIISNAILKNETKILEENKKDILLYKKDDLTFLDRLTLNKKRLESMALSIQDLINIEDEVFKEVEEFKGKQDINIKKIRAPLGVILVIYEARPNVTSDVIALSIKSANSIILKGGKESYYTNKAIYLAIKEGLEENGFSSDFIGFIDSKDRETTKKILKEDKYIDVVIPRGSENLKNFILENSKIPVISSAGGNCHIYLDSDFDLNIAKKVIYNAKMQRPTVCNALEQLVVHKNSLKYLKEILEPLYIDGCELLGDEESVKSYNKIKLTDSKKYYEEHLAYVLSIKVVDSIDEAISFINEHSTKHSESIISNIDKNIKKFYVAIDSACVYSNTSTRFTDGFEFGFGAEIGISTQKLHARGPLALKELSSIKYIIESEGQIRK